MKVYLNVKDSKIIEIELDRKVLADLAVNNAGEFTKLVELVKL